MSASPLFSPAPSVSVLLFYNYSRAFLYSFRPRSCFGLRAHLTGESRADLPSHHRRQTSLVLARSIHGISPHGSRKAVDCRQPRQTAHRSHALSPSLRTRPLAHGLYTEHLAPLSSPRSVTLASLSSILPTLVPRLTTPLHTPYTVSQRGCGASQLHGTRQLRNNNNAVKRCSGVRHRNATSWIVCDAPTASRSRESLVDNDVCERNPRGG